MSEEFQSALTGNYIAGQIIAFRHKCWRDRIPWFGTRHLLALARSHGIVASKIVDVP